MQLLDRSLEADASTWHLLARIELLGAELAVAVARRRALQTGKDDGFRGLYVSDEHVDALLAGRPPAIEGSATAGVVARVEDEVTRLEGAGTPSSLRVLARRCGLADADVALLLVAVAADVDPAFHPLFAYLQDDVTRPRPGAALALELACGPRGPLAERRRLGPAGALVARGLVRVEDPGAPFPARTVVAGGRVVAHLLGDDTPDPMVAAVTIEPPPIEVDPGDGLAGAIAHGRSVCAFDPHGDATGSAAGACRAAGKAPLVVDLARAPGDVDDASLAASVSLEATLGGRMLVAAGVEERPGVASLLLEAIAPVVLAGTRPWDPSRSARPIASIPVPPLGRAGRAALWRTCLGDVPFDPAEATAHFRLTGEEIAAAGGLVRAGARTPTPDLVREAARLQSSAGLERLATRVEPRATWDDLVLPDTVVEVLRDVAARAVHRGRVLTEWRMGGPAARARGVVALFAGPSGTGKTLAAEVLARELGLDLYVVNLASVVDKYVGETEKNLERIFAEASHVNGVLLFDEADALFGKRSGVEDARDRYANVEVSYLLQRIESFDGVALLTSNLRGNVDEAFARRLDAVVEMPLPDEAARLRLWDVNLSPALPRDDGVDLAFLARFELSGGNVRNACVSAAYRAAAAERAVRMEDLVRGVAQEYSKLGRLCTEGEFGDHYALVTGARPLAR